MASLMSGLEPGTVGQDTMNLTEKKNDAKISHFLNKSRNFFLFFPSIASMIIFNQDKR